MLWMHGGGWTTGTIELDDYQLRAQCVELQISILNVEYRLVPEYPYSMGLEDCYASLKWAAESPSLFSADLAKGHLATILAHRARDDPFFDNRKVTGQVLQVPPVLHPHAVPEKYKSSLLLFEQNKEGPGAETILWATGMLGGSPTDPEILPFLYPSHKGLPSVVIQVCGMDPLRDEALLYEKALKSDGVHWQTRLSVYSGVTHAFQYYFLDFKMTVKWEKDYWAGLRWLLEGGLNNA
ncbi:Alpha/Beta hydrolase protein [Mycena sp. CBHHK59/15]|nr:Alpha/Beta hydrolase protein [Mycena sp. CBHHK59/15]